MRWTAALAIGFLLVAGAIVRAEQGALQDATDRIERVGPHLYRVGRVELNAQERTLRCPGRVNMAEGGPIELLACTPTGKTHETVFTLPVEPTDLQVALLLLGLVEGRNPAVEPPEGAPEPDGPPGGAVSIFVEWRPPDSGGTEDEEEEEPPRRERAERFLYRVDEERAETDVRWVFLGSRMVRGRFGADIDGSLITTFHDPLAILEIQKDTVNDDIYYSVNEDLCPPVDTPVTLIIEVPDKDDEKPSGEEGEEDSKTEAGSE
jgi:hypothetical protein